MAKEAADRDVEDWWGENGISDERCWKLLDDVLGDSSGVSLAEHALRWQAVEGSVGIKRGRGDKEGTGEEVEV